jgi:IclR family acetate operon transcriptional repressor
MSSDPAKPGTPNVDIQTERPSWTESTGASGRATNPTRIQSVSRAIHVVLAVARENDHGATATEIARATSLATPTTFHLLSTLVEGGMLAKQDRRYYLGPIAGLMAQTFLRDRSAPQYLLGPLEELGAETRETAYLSNWEHGEIAVLAVVEGQHPVNVAGPHLGFAGSAHARASGHVLLAALHDAPLQVYLDAHPLERLTPNTVRSRKQLAEVLERVRERGHAVDEEGFREGVECLAVPIRVDNTVVGAYSVAAPRERFEAYRDQYLAAATRAAERAVSRTA